MALGLGVDGGGTQTRCLVIDEHGNKIGFGVGGASKPDAVDPAVGRVQLQASIRAACEVCGGPGAIDAAFLGLGGVVSAADVQVVLAMLDGVGLRPGIPIGVDHDIRIALAGGAAGQPGIALIVGTGSSCYGRNAAGQSWRSGGWGYILDDWGSGFNLGQHALIAIVRAHDGRGPQTALSQPVLAALGITDINAIMNHIYTPKLNHAGIAALAPLVTRAAEAGDPVALAIIARGCAELALMVATTQRQLALPDDTLVVPVGSLAEVSVIFRTALERAILQVLPAARIQSAVAPAVAGAAWLALEQIGVTLSPATLSALKTALA
jgi:N-acetylglucosamine kinase-like BadF-type ATPase